MNTTNPKISSSTSVHQMLLDMPKENPGKFTVVGTIAVPNWGGINDISNHFQGIAPLNGVVAITGQISASASSWWCASFVESGDPATVTAVFGTGYYDHAGGIQRLGDLLPVPLENDRGEATVAFYDVRTSSPQLLYEVHLGGKASAVAITNYRDSAGVEQAMLLIYRYDPKSFYAYRAPVDKLGDKESPWEFIKETRNIEHEDDDQYQCFALVTEQTSSGDRVVLLGFREDEEVVRYYVETGSSTFGDISVIQWTYVDWSGSQWRNGVGLQICSPTKIRLFGCDADPKGDSDDYEFPIYYWG
ncbi:MAG TPA: hypothetical protein VKB93_07030 [Thermoanaerobaculia bacterium]|nr:hypothetical protein [Thermoanaerobaculia bacterium]